MRHAGCGLTEKEPKPTIITLYSAKGALESPTLLRHLQHQMRAEGRAAVLPTDLRIVAVELEKLKFTPL